MSHRAFISYHHDADQWYANYLRENYGDGEVFFDESLAYAYPDSWPDDRILSDIRTEHLRDSTVTVVLIGAETAGRKWVDWEINASLRPYGKRTRNGLLGIYLPGCGDAPARLQDNIDSGYAVTMVWNDVAWRLEDKIQEAFDLRGSTDLVENSRPLRRRNG